MRAKVQRWLTPSARKPLQSLRGLPAAGKLKPLEGWGAINGTAPRKKREIFEKPRPDNTSVQEGKRAMVE